MKISRELKAGLITIFTLVSFAFLISFLKGEKFFNSGKTAYVIYEDIAELSASRSISLNGIKVGVVKSVDFYKKDLTKNIVELSIDTDYPLTNKAKVVIVPASVLGVTSIKIVPSTEGELLKDEDFLTGVIEEGTMSSVIDKIEPLKEKLESTLTNLDKNLVGLQSVLTEENTEQIAKLLVNLNKTVLGFKTASSKIDRVLGSSDKLIASTNGLVSNANGMILGMKGDIKSTLKNFNQTSENLNGISSELKNANLSASIAKLDKTLVSLNKLMLNVERGNGSLGKLMKDEKLYNNLEGATAELESLMKDFKANPKRYVHFSVFGKKKKKNKEEQEK